MASSQYEINLLVNGKRASVRVGASTINEARELAKAQYSGNQVVVQNARKIS